MVQSGAVHKADTIHSYLWAADMRLLIRRHYCMTIWEANIAIVSDLFKGKSCKTFHHFIPAPFWISTSTAGWKPTQAALAKVLSSSSFILLSSWRSLSSPLRWRWNESSSLSCMASQSFSRISSYTWGTQLECNSTILDSNPAESETHLWVWARCRVSVIVRCSTSESQCIWYRGWQ